VTFCINGLAGKLIRGVTWMQENAPGSHER
jgi:hypothetical protein